MSAHGFKTLSSAFLIQVFIIAVFAALFGLQDLSSIQLRQAGIEPELLSTVGGAFQRYAVWLFLAAMSILLLPLKDRSLFSNPPRRSDLLVYSCLGFFLFVLVLTRALQFPLSGDDSYIGYRYSYNWANSLGLYFNPGEKLMGMTSHLHLFILSVFSRLLRIEDISLISQNFNLFLQICNYYLLFYLGRQLNENRYWALAAAAVYALSSYQISECFFGKESSLVTTLLLLSLFAFHFGRENLRAWLAALLILTRPEGGLWLLSNLLISFRKFGLRAWKSWILPLLFLALFAALLFYFFGGIVPHGFIGKSKMYAHRDAFTAFFILLRRFGYGSFCPEFTFPMLDPLFRAAHLYMALYGGFIAILASLKFLEHPTLRYYTWNAFAFFLLFSLSNPCMFDWYHCWFSLIPCFLVPELSLRLFTFIKSRPAKLELLLSCLICFYMGAVQISQLFTRPTPGLPAVTFYINDSFRRLLIYKEAALYLNSLEKKDKVCAVVELGIFAYYYKGKVLDLGALVSPEILPYFPVSPEFFMPGSNYAIPIKAINDLKPDYLLTDGSFGGAGIMKDSEFLKNYKLLKFYDFPLWSKGVYLYERN
ncbi:MAG: hypothetical protein K2X27_14060 [Candidatus Obscuribacterales bacterium]|nr:hypothetical protein [Candidatus Obscuribacterales bacterium]